MISALAENLVLGCTRSPSAAHLLSPWPSRAALPKSFDFFQASTSSASVPQRWAGRRRTDAHVEGHRWTDRWHR